MSALESVEIKAFVPARDFAQAKAFYRDLGFTMASEGGGIAYFHHGSCSFLLQDYYVEAFAQNLQMHLLVKDAPAWHAMVHDSGLAQRHGVRVTALEEQPWGMVDFTLTDPSGVCWRIGHNIPGWPGSIVRDGA